MDKTTLNAAERFLRRLWEFRGRTIRVTMIINTNGLPEVGTIEDVGKAERFAKEKPDFDYTRKPS